MGRQTGRNLRNRRHKQQIKKGLRQQSKQKKKERAAALRAPVSAAPATPESSQRPSPGV